jgi:hypothetical protein
MMEIYPFDREAPHAAKDRGTANLVALPPLLRTDELGLINMPMAMSNTRGCRSIKMRQVAQEYYVS